MIYMLSARAYLLIQDNGLSPCEAIMCVCRRIDRNLRNYYFGQISCLLAEEGL